MNSSCFSGLVFLFLVVVGVFCNNPEEDLRRPKNLHLAFTNSPHEMVISYWTHSRTEHTQCEYYSGNTSIPEDALSTSGTMKTYGGLNSGFNHNVKLTGLAIDNVYFYRCGDGKIKSDWESFVTRKENITSFTFGVYGDLGIENSAATMESLKNIHSKNNWDFIWHLGDISYANEYNNFEAVWKTWFERMSSILSTMPYMVTVGNHEKWSRDPVLHYGSRNFTPFEQKFRMPGQESVGEDTNLFYSFDFGPVHVVSICTEWGFPGYPVKGEEIETAGINGTQYELNPMGYNEPHPVDLLSEEETYLQMNWLIEDLQKANANRHNVPWIFVGGHRPVYEVNDQKNGVPKGVYYNLQQWLEPLFKQYEVDIYFAGHVHHYSRNWPIYNNTVEKKSYDKPKDTTYIIQGAAGNLEGKMQVDRNHPDWLAFANTDYGFGEITIYNATTLRWRAYHSGTNNVIDEITLVRNRRKFP